jgi:hypothetical protein
VIAPALVVATAVAAWQFGPSGPAPAAEGSVTQVSQTFPVAGHAGTGLSRIESLAGQGLNKAVAQATASPRASAAASSTPHRAQPVTASRPPTVAAKPAPAGLTCTGTSTSGMLPANYAEIVQFLTAHGYTAMAAAGMAGNMYQESCGDPESVGTGGGGLIGWTPLPAGFVTGNPAADLHIQLGAVLTFNQTWAADIPALNTAATPAQAADIYMNDFERPAQQAAAAYNREGAANAVAQACGIVG